MVYALITYGMAGLNHDPAKCALSILIQTLTSLIAVQVLHLAAILAPNQDIAFMVAIAWTAINMLMSNFFITFSQMTLGWISQVGGQFPGGLDLLQSPSSGGPPLAVPFPHTLITHPP